MKNSAFCCLSFAAFLAFCACSFGQTEEVPPERQPVEITQGQPPQPAPESAKPSAAVPANSQPDASNASSSSPAAAPSLLDQPSEPAKVDLTAGRLTVRAANSSLSDILHQVSKASGMKIDGLQAGKDQRVFGIYGPGEPRDVLSDLLDGSGYNIMMLGQMPSGVPRELALTSRTAGGPPGQAQPQPADNSQDDNADDDVQPTQYPDDQQNLAQPPSPPEMRNGLRTPQQILQELQRMHQQQQQEQQEQQNQQNQPDDQPQN